MPWMMPSLPIQDRHIAGQASYLPTHPVCCHVACFCLTLNWESNGDGFSQFEVPLGVLPLSQADYGARRYLIKPKTTTMFTS